MSCGQAVDRRIDVPVMSCTTLAGPGTLRQGQSPPHGTAGRAALAGRLEALDTDRLAAVPGGLVPNPQDERRPARIANGLGQTAMALPVLHTQRLVCDHWVFVYHTGRELVQKITPGIGDAGMRSGDFQPGLDPVVGAYLLAGKTPLECGQTPFVLDEKPLGLDLLAGRENAKVAQSEVNGHLGLDLGSGTHLVFALERDEVATGPVFGDGHG